MDTSKRRRLPGLVGALALVLAGVGPAAAMLVSAPAAGAAPYTKGDVFVSIGNGKVEEYTPSGTAVQTLNTGTAGTETTGSTFDSAGHFYVTSFEANGVTQFDANGAVVAPFGGPYNQHPESILTDASGNFYVGQADGSHQILKFSSSGALLASFTATTDSRGTDWIDLASDQCTIFFDSEGQHVQRFNVCTNTQLSDFSAALPGANAFALRILPDGGVLVADTSEVVRLNSSGAVIHTYIATGDSFLFALNLDPDGTSFWTADIGNGDVAHFDIASGTELGHFNGLAVGGGTDVAGLSVRGELTSAHQFAITLAPPTGSDTVGGSHTVTANTTDNGAPLAGQTVTFSITSGPNAGKTGTGVTNSAGQTTFTYADTGGAGTDSISAKYTDPAGIVLTSTAVTETWTGGGGDTTPPACALTGVISGPPKQIQITVQDNGGGLNKITVTSAVNATVPVPAFTVGTTSPVVVTATKIDQSKASTVALQVSDVAGNVTNCDPILTTVTRGDDSVQTLKGVPGAEHFVRIFNGSPGLRIVVVTVNGHVFRVPLTDGATASLDIGSAMRGGANRITLQGRGPKGSSADLIIQD